ncbi:MAG: plasmid stabilization protein [Planctomycetes bacterium]|nr:plasmid stabilization protein [Planctomycetota bacterium]
MKVHWTDTAQGHLDSIHRYIAQDSTEYALREKSRVTT